MKHALSALTLAIMGAGAVLANPPQTVSQPAYTASYRAPAQTCELRLNEPRLVALANPAQAASWSLSIDAAGFVNQQSGPVTGDSSRLRPVTRLFMGGIGIASPGGGQFYGGSPSLPRPFYAELTVFDGTGAAICRDVIDLPQRPAFGSQRLSAGPR